MDFDQYKLVFWLLINLVPKTSGIVPLRQFRLNDFFKNAKLNCRSKCMAKFC